MASMWPKSFRLNLSMTWSAVAVWIRLAPQPAAVTESVVSTTNASPSHLPTEHPSHVGSVSLPSAADGRR